MRAGGHLGESGFSLMSTILAMMLLGLAVSALSSSTVFIVAARTDSAVRTKATAIAVSYLEEVKTRSEGAVKAEAATQVNESGAIDPAGRFTRSLDVNDASGLANTKRLTVTVGYPSGMGRERMIRLETIIFEGSSR